MSKPYFSLIRSRNVSTLVIFPFTGLHIQRWALSPVASMFLQLLYPINDQNYTLSLSLVRLTILFEKLTGSELSYRMTAAYKDSSHIVLAKLLRNITIKTKYYPFYSSKVI